MPVAVPIAVKVYPINVGQGDAILLEVKYDDVDASFKRYLIDGGRGQKEANTLNKETGVTKVTPFNNLIKALEKCISDAPESTSSEVEYRLEAIVNTHPDVDHHGGINALLGSKSGKKFTVFCPIITTSAARLSVTKEVERKNYSYRRYKRKENAECPHFWFQKKARGLVYTRLEDLPLPSHVEIRKDFEILKDFEKNLKDCKKDCKKNLEDCKKKVKYCEKNLKDCKNCKKKNCKKKNCKKNLKDCKKKVKDCKKNLQDCKKDCKKKVKDCEKKVKDCKKNLKDCNETSILTTVRLSRSKYEYDVVLTGDSTDSIILGTLGLKCKTVGVFQVPHHGSSNNSSYEFYMQFDADIYFISHGAHKTYHHPHKEVITGILSAAVEKKRHCIIVVTATWFEESKINYFMRRSTSNWRKFVKIYYFKESSSYITLDCSKLDKLDKIKGLTEYTECQEKEQRKGIDNVICKRSLCDKVTRCATNGLCAKCLTCTVCDEFTNESDDKFTAVCKRCGSRAHADGKAHGKAETMCTKYKRVNKRSYVCIKCRTCTICEKLCEKETKKSRVIKCGVCEANARVRPISTDASNYICCNCKCDLPAKQTRLISHDSLEKKIRKIIQVDGDGDCFFNAMAINITKNKPNEWQQVPALQLITRKQTSKYLRTVLVNELLGKRRRDYEDLAPPSVKDYEKEVKKFLTPKFYNSPIGDFMPRALATALNCSIVIVYKDPKREALTFLPTEGATIATAYLRYDPEGTGHYDVFIPP